MGETERGGVQPEAEATGPEVSWMGRLQAGYLRPRRPSEGFEHSLFLSLQAGSRALQAGFRLTMRLQTP